MAQLADVLKAATVASAETIVVESQAPGKLEMKAADTSDRVRGADGLEQTG